MRIRNEHINLTSINRVNLSTQAAEQIREKILTGAWPPGAKIPTETELTKMLGVSRITIREAIKKLAALDLLTIRIGDGTYVKSIDTDSHLSAIVPFLANSKTGILEILEFRRMIEIGALRLAIDNATSNDIEELDASVQKMEEVKTNIEEYAAEDFNFHYRIVLMSRNTIAIHVYSMIRESLKTSLKNIVTPRGQSNATHFHPMVLEAIKEKNHDLAVKHMEDHLQNVIERIYNDKTISKI